MSSIEDFIDQVTSQDFAKAGPTFNELLNAKLTDALETEKIKISNQVYNAMGEDDQLELDLEEPEDDVEEDDSESLDDEEEETKQ